jgi:hypothetical protein
MKTPKNCPPVGKGKKHTNVDPIASAAKPSFSEAMAMEYKTKPAKGK